MGDGTTTRMQKELAALHQKHDSLEAKLDAKYEQLDAKIDSSVGRLQTSMDQLAMDMRDMRRFMEAMQKRSDQTHESRSVTPDLLSNQTSALAGSSNENQGQSRVFTKRSKIECPRFNGTNFFGWHSKINLFSAADATAEKDKIPTIMMHLEGQALQWHLRYMRTMEHTSELTWFTYLFAMRERFGCNEYMKPFAQLVALKQTGSVDDYFNAFETLLNLCNCSEEQALSIFLTNLKLDISRQVQVNHPQTLNQAVNYARHIEFLLTTTNGQQPSNTFLPISAAPVTHIPYKPPKKPASILQSPNSSPLITYPKSLSSKSDSPPSPKIPKREERDAHRKQGLCMWCGDKV
ncbi:Retrotransposon gag protein [Corchorus olitorius]|uniref:Retrotransposon gag protein n=1 Tax=Corchorus olitorius TaxID=93759 RepID=A0A1R3IZ59_9ROSI|nr:Retrotransposon gag protein [Corchorus olitorius]